MTPSGVLSVLQRALYPPVRIEAEGTTALNSFGDDLQDRCSWWGYKPLWTIPRMQELMRSIFNKDSIEQVDVSDKLLLESAKLFLQFKNMANTRADVTVYKLYPRMDMPQLMTSTDGVNPPIVQGWFGAADNPLPDNPSTQWASLRRGVFNEHDADITVAGSSKFFRIKKVMRKFLEPGQFVILKMADRRPKLVSKAMFGVVAGQSFADYWDHFKAFGPILLFRVQGSATHNKSLATAPADNKQLGSTMSSYNVEFYVKGQWTARENPALSSRHGIISERLPVFAVANEKGVEIRQAQVANMDIGGP